jgi:hypothetical protein
VSPRQRESPAGQSGATSKTPIPAGHFTAHRRQDGYAAPSAEDRVDHAVVAAAEALGYRIAVQCLDCGHWLANPKSVAAHRGPRCRARVGDDR